MDKERKIHMSLVTVKELLLEGAEKNASVIGFICIDYNMAASVIAAAERTNKPAIVMLLPEHVTLNKTAQFKPFADMVIAMAKKSSARIALHLDHSFSEEQVYEAIDAGFTSVMFDASADGMEENIRRTKAVVEYAHARGVAVEAELGCVGLAMNQDNEKTDFYTRPEDVKKFCEETGVDSLAIAIGNAHGDYPFPPKLDLERLDAINAVTDVALVLHGGSGIPDEQLAEAFSRGINKFNYGTDVLRCYNMAVRAYLEAHTPAASLDMLGVPEAVQTALTDYICKKMELVKL